MSTSASRQYNWVTDKNASTPITASRMDGEFDAIITKLNQKVIIATSAPSGPIAGMLWLDSTNKILKQYRNSEWVVMGAVHVGTAAPTTCQEGDLWYDSTNNKLNVYTTTTAKEIVLTSGGFGTLGQMLYSSGGSGTAPISLAMGTLNKFLTTQGIGSAPIFKTFSDVILTTYALGAWVTSNGVGTTYQAATDGFVCAYAAGAGASGDMIGYTDVNATPTTIIQKKKEDPTGATDFYSFMFPVKKSDYWKVTTTNWTVTVQFIPLGQ